MHSYPTSRGSRRFFTVYLLQLLGYSDVASQLIGPGAGSSQSNTSSGFPNNSSQFGGTNSTFGTWFGEQQSSSSTQQPQAQRTLSAPSLQQPQPTQTQDVLSVTPQTTSLSNQSSQLVNNKDSIPTSSLQNKPGIRIPADATSPSNTTYNMTSLGLFGQPAPCPGVTGNCTYPATLQTSTGRWECPAGFFCMIPGSQVACTPGFYCPENAAQAIYCPPGYFCSLDTKTVNICPAGKYCPRGTVDPLPCIGYCPEGSSSSNKLWIGLSFVFVAFGIGVLFIFKSKADRQQNLRRKQAIALRMDPSLGFEKPQLSRLPRTFDVEFDNLGLVLPGGIQIMKGVTGTLRAGRSTAIMGPSGAGKTTFVTLLTNKVQRTSGTVRINGQRDELSNYSKLIGYVPQEDVMLRELTVYDILLHSARMRLPSDWDFARIEEKVIDIINFLGLTHVAQSIIGDAEKRGISGGQRKRVNIGMELVAEPSVLFLDEPTSGLDSSTAFEICSNLRNIAFQQGLTVAAVIHSPSPATFRQFDDFLLLGKGGRVVYMGPREDCLMYFDSIGFTCPADESPSDFYMDVVSGKVPSAFDPAFEPKHLFDYWEKYTAGQHPFEKKGRMDASDAKSARQSFLRSYSIKVLNRAASDKSPNSLHLRKLTRKLTKNSTIKDEPLPKPVLHVPFEDDAPSGGIIKYLKRGIYAFFHDWWKWLVDVCSEFAHFLWSIVRALTGRKDPIRQTCSFFMQLKLLMLRALKLRTAASLIAEIAIHFASGTFISLAVQNFDFLGAAPEEMCLATPWIAAYSCTNPSDRLREAGMFIALGCLFSGMSIGAGTFGPEKVVFWRDTSSGMNTIPYFLGKILVDIPRLVLGATMFSSALVLFFPYRQSFTGIFLNVLLLYFSAFGMGYWLSAAFPVHMTSLLSICFALLWSLALSGVAISLEDVVNYPIFPRLFWYISPPRWSIEAFWIHELQSRPWVEKDKPATHTYSFENYGFSLCMLLAIGAGWYLLAFLGLKLFNRKKQK